MSRSSDPFASAHALEDQFASGLSTLLDAHRTLGVYILVLANAAYDDALWQRLAPALAARHAELAAELTAALRAGRALDAPDDDVMVFLKLDAIGFAHLGRLECRHAGPWEVMFNPLRALRPPRASAARFAGLEQPFDAAAFHFNKPFLAKEVMWEGTLAGKPARLLYNKFPFARLHGLLVPEPALNSPQWLTPALHDWAWQVCAHSAVPGLCLGYNSLGAGASVNHLHFQSFVRGVPLPVQSARFAHNGGRDPYPLPCLRFTDPVAAWQTIAALHKTNTPYNLVYGQAELHVVPRVAQDAPGLVAHARGYGWSEMAGAVTVFTREAYEACDAATFAADLARFAPS